MIDWHGIRKEIPIMSTYKIIACDMDETLLSSDATICQRNINMIKRAAAQGIKFVPCTGRGYRSVEGVLQTLGLSNEPHQYVIGFNGANITENKDSTCLYWDSIPFDLASTLYKQLASYGLCTHIYTRNDVYIANITADEAAFLQGRMAYIGTNEKTLDFLHQEEIGKLIIMNTDDAVLAAIRHEMEPLLSDIDVSYSSNRYMEFMHKGVTKGIGLQQLAAMLHVPMKETMAIGDNINDIEMLKAAGLSIGVHNLNPAIRQYCDVVTTSDNNGGAVAEAIERFALND
jgi:Cof subfamily protein (haloacid dehalogenase superfamily)